MIKGAINRPVTVSMFLLAISLFGYISLDRLALEPAPRHLVSDTYNPNRVRRRGAGRSGEADYAADRRSRRGASRTYTTQFGLAPRAIRSGPRVSMGREDGSRESGSPREARCGAAATRCQAPGSPAIRSFVRPDHAAASVRQGDESQPASLFR